MLRRTLIVLFYCPLSKFEFTFSDEVDPINLRLSLRVHSLSSREVDLFHEQEYLLNYIRLESLKYSELPQKVNCALLGPSFLLPNNP